MSSPVVTREEREASRTPKSRFTGRQKVVAATAAVLLVAAGLVGLALMWPFDQARVVQELAEAGDSTLTIRGFHKTYFPTPGCVVDGLVFRHGNQNTPPLMTIDKVTIAGSYSGMLRHHVSRITAEGMYISVPPFGSERPFTTHPSDIVVDEIVANGALLEFRVRDDPQDPVRFNVHEASLRNVGWKGPLQYRVKLHIPQPPGELESSGDFGVWHQDDAGATPLSGEYKFDHADLSVYGGIAGTLSSQGKFSGVLRHIDISGSTDIPDFEVESGNHKVQLLTEFSAYVDGTHGDTFLNRVDAHFARTHVVAKGSIARVPGRKGKTGLIELSVARGRIEDILGLFVKADRAPMSGAVGLKATAELPSGDLPFLKKIKLQGRFGVDEGSFNSPETQVDVNKLSAGARGENKDEAETVLTDLKGQFALSGGTATFPELGFGVPGASARMHGTYSVIDHRINLHGHMWVDTEMSKTTTGVKALLLKAMDPFFRKKHHGEIVPVHIGGTYEHPSYGLDVGGGAPPKKDSPTKQK
jgi:hypothetical protein